MLALIVKIDVNTGNSLNVNDFIHICLYSVMEFPISESYSSCWPLHAKKELITLEKWLLGSLKQRDKIGKSIIVAKRKSSPEASSAHVHDSSGTTTFDNFVASGQGSSRGK